MISEVVGVPWRMLHVMRFEYGARNDERALAVYRLPANCTFVLCTNRRCELWHLAEAEQCTSVSDRGMRGGHAVSSCSAGGAGHRCMGPAAGPSLEHGSVDERMDGALRSGRRP